MVLRLRYQIEFLTLGLLLIEFHLLILRSLAH